MFTRNFVSFVSVRCRFTLCLPSPPEAKGTIHMAGNHHHPFPSHPNHRRPFAPSPLSPHSIPGVSLLPTSFLLGGPFETPAPTPAATVGPGGRESCNFSTWVIELKTLLLFTHPFFHSGVGSVGARAGTRQGRPSFIRLSSSLFWSSAGLPPFPVRKLSTLC